jgi:predicted transcriptional regulator
MTEDAMVDRTRRRPGELEVTVLRALWATDRPITARQILAGFSADAPAMTTLLTVLDRLATKGQVEKIAGPDGALVFSAAQSESTHAAGQMLETLVKVDNRSATLLQFAGDLDSADVEILRRALGRTAGD